MRSVAQTVGTFSFSERKNVFTGQGFISLQNKRTKSTIHSSSFKVRTLVRARTFKSSRVIR
jgi:hypothetical protein